MSGYGYDGALTLAGVIDQHDAEILGMVLDFHCSVQLGHTFESLLGGECEFFFDTADTWELPEDVAEIARRFHLSWMFYARPCHDGMCRLTIDDREVETRAELAIFEGDIHIQPGQEAQRAEIEALLARWPSVDEAPKLHFVHSNHQALALGGADFDQTKAIEAYMVRRAARTAAPEPESAR